jgi:hypothetical protein
MGLEFYDISLVDGFNLPMIVRPYRVASGDKCKPLKCSFNFNVCPNNFKEVAGGGGTIVACKSACSALRERQYCCPPPDTQDTCKPTEYSKIFKRQCPDAFSYAYDNPTSEWACKGQSPGSSSYEVIFCPA